MGELLTSLSTPALVALLLAGSVLVAFSDWRIRAAALLVEYAGASALLTQLVIAEVALVKLITGFVVVTIFGLTAWQVNPGRPATTGSSPRLIRFELPTGLPFRLMAVIMTVVSALFVASQPQWTLPGLDQAPSINAASYTLMALGLLNLGLTDEPTAAGMALLTLLLGFEVFYVAVEPSLAVVALLAAVELAVVLAACYLASLQRGPGEGEAAS